MSAQKPAKHSESRYSDPKWIPPTVHYGRGLISEATRTKEKYIVATMEIPWNIVKEKIVSPPAQVIYVSDMHKETLERIESQVSNDIDMVLGVGGGSSHDTAKYLALKKNARLVQFPTIFGGDAVVTTSVGIRDQGRVRYIGHVITDEIYVDFDTIGRAPETLVRYGSADILSSYTALLDWQYASEQKRESFDERNAKYAREQLLGRLLKNSSEVRQVTDTGIRTIVELYLDYHRLANQLDTDRAQEGSEHFFAYNAEYVTRRTFLHGALLSLGIWIVGGYYYERLSEIEQILKELGLAHSLNSAGLSEEEFRRTLTTLKHFAQEGGYYYSIAHERELSSKVIDQMIACQR